MRKFHKMFKCVWEDKERNKKAKKLKCLCKNSVRRSQESITEHHNDMGKSHLHLLSTHLINIHDYKN